MGCPCPIDISVFSPFKTNLLANIIFPVSDLKEEPFDYLRSYILVSNFDINVEIDEGWAGLGPRRGRTSLGGSVLLHA